MPSQQLCPALLQSHSSSPDLSELPHSLTPPHHHPPSLATRPSTLVALSSLFTSTEQSPAGPTTITYSSPLAWVTHSVRFALTAPPALHRFVLFFPCRDCLLPCLVSVQPLPDFYTHAANAPHPSEQDEITFLDYTLFRHIPVTERLFTHSKFLISTVLHLPNVAMTKKLERLASETLSLISTLTHTHIFQSCQNLLAILN